ncbi:MAG: electron transfer flavoprotein subunit alpha/FixB family protein, partial [Candidatus Eremiobacteraeota bacterium]|nr:electron transfer flavoprotein subunit alpha/FixB family protein [Candidatus Eremiobacteraeota bacterium]
MKNVIVYAEHRAGQTRKVTFEMATEARRLADALGGQAYGVAVGPGAASLAEQLKTYPLDVIFVNEDGDADKYLLDPVVDYVEAAAKSAGPSLVLIPNTLSGRDLAGRLVARLNAGIGADVTDFKVDNG